MHKRAEFEISSDNHSFKDETIAYFVGSGFKLAAESSNYLSFKRGSNLLNIITINPLKWKSTIEVNLVNNKVIAKFEISTFGQDITHKEDALWDSFINNFQRTIHDGSDLSAENKKQLKTTLLYNLTYVKWAILGAIGAGIPSGVIAYYSGVDSIASIGAVIGALGLMKYKLEKEKK